MTLYIIMYQGVQAARISTDLERNAGIKGYARIPVLVQNDGMVYQRCVSNTNLAAQASTVVNAGRPSSFLSGQPVSPALQCCLY